MRKKYKCKFSWYFNNAFGVMKFISLNADKNDEILNNCISKYMTWILTFIANPLTKSGSTKVLTVFQK